MQHYRAENVPRDEAEVKLQRSSYLVETFLLLARTTKVKRHKFIHLSMQTYIQKYLLHMHVQGVKQSFLSVVIVIVIVCRRRHKNCQISRSKHQATSKHNESIEFGKKLASVYFKSFGTAHESHK